MISVEPPVVLHDGGPLLDIVALILRHELERGGERQTSRVRFLPIATRLRITGAFRARADAPGFDRQLGECLEVVPEPLQLGV